MTAGRSRRPAGDPLRRTPCAGRQAGPPPARRSTGAPGRGPGPRRDRGNASLEFLGMLPVLLLIAFAGIQLGLVAYVASQAGTAARTAARTAALHDAGLTGEQAGAGSVSDWLQDGTDVAVTGDGDSVTATVSITIPSVIPGVDVFEAVERSATMPKEDTAP